LAAAPEPTTEPKPEPAPEPKADVKAPEPKPAEPKAEAKPKSPPKPLPEDEEEDSVPSVLGRPTPRTSQAIKTLKCAECGSMNYPTEWYCERCGGELAAL
jgi:outer membrane biosynthesis protein TonB